MFKMIRAGMALWATRTIRMAAKAAPSLVGSRIRIRIHQPLATASFGVPAPISRRMSCSSLNLIGQLASGDRSGSSVGWRSGGDHLLLCEWDGVKEGLHRGLAKAPAALMRPVLVVAPDPLIKVGLQLGDRAAARFRSSPAPLGPATPGARVFIERS